MSLAPELPQKQEDDVARLVSGVRTLCVISENESSTNSPQGENINLQSSSVTSQATAPKKHEGAPSYGLEEGKCRWPKLRKKTPPIYLHGYRKWLSKEEHFARYDIKIKKWTRKSSNVKIELASDRDHQNMVEILEFFNIAYHTYSLADNRAVKFVVRGVPERASEALVAEELRARGLPVERVQRMHVGGERRRVPLVLVVLPHAAASRRILDVRELLGRRVSVERLRRDRRQCHRCQRFGHAQRYCRGAARCVRCSGGHESAACPRDAPPACANCRRSHPANYPLCARAPQTPDSHC